MSTENSPPPGLLATIAALLEQVKDSGQLVDWLAGAAQTPDDTPPLSADLLRGANEIAQFMFGDPARRRIVYRLIAKRLLPHFRLGNAICARKSVLEAWMESQEGIGIRSAGRAEP